MNSRRDIPCVADMSYLLVITSVLSVSQEDLTFEKSSLISACIKSFNLQTTGECERISRWLG